MKFFPEDKLPKKLPKYMEASGWVETAIESFQPLPFAVIRPIRVRIRRLSECEYMAEWDCDELPFAQTGDTLHDAYHALKTGMAHLASGGYQLDALPDSSPPPDLSILTDYIARKPRHDA